MAKLIIQVCRPSHLCDPALDAQANNGVLAAADYIKKRLATKNGLNTADIELGNRIMSGVAIIKKLLNAATSTQVIAGVIPIGTTLPAIGITQISGKDARYVSR